MDQILFKIIQMSGMASVVIGAVILARMCLHRFPKKYTYMLWFVVGFRLLCPVSLQSNFSVFNLTPVKIITQSTSVKNVARISEHTPTVIATQGASNAAKEVTTFLGLTVSQWLLVIWAIGFCLIIGLAMYKYVRLCVQLKSAKKVDHRIYESPLISSPFVIGILSPRIYLPMNIAKEERKYLIMHEQVHIQYGDYFMKCLAFVASALHWFNPLVWIAYLLYSKDVEMRCDEVVIDKLGYCIKKDYSISLVTYAMKNEDETYVVIPLNFSHKGIGGLEVKMRIKNILNYKKASKIVVALTVVAVGGVSLFCASNAKEVEPIVAVEGESETTEADGTSIKAEFAVENPSQETTASSEVYVDDTENVEIKTEVPDNDEYAVEVNKDETTDEVEIYAKPIDAPTHNANAAEVLDNQNSAAVETETMNAEPEGKTAHVYLEREDGKVFVQKVDK